MIQTDTTFVGGLNGLEPFVIGSVVEVEGITNSQGGVTANEIHLRKYLFKGTVEEINKNSWQISGIKLSITPHTQIGEGIEVGDEVNVLIRSEDHGLYALSIQSTATLETLPPIPSTMIIDPTEHHDIETHEAITTPDVEHPLNTEETRHEEAQGTPEPLEDGEHDGSTTVESNENHETEEQIEEATTTPEQHESPEPTEDP
jgi:hypothetical protein